MNLKCSPKKMFWKRPISSGFSIVCKADRKQEHKEHWGCHQRSHPGSLSGAQAACVGCLLTALFSSGFKGHVSGPHFSGTPEPCMELRDMQTQLLRRPGGPGPYWTRRDAETHRRSHSQHWGGQVFSNHRKIQSSMKTKTPVYMLTYRNVWELELHSVAVSPGRQHTQWPAACFLHRWTSWEEDMLVKATLENLAL